MLEPELFPRRLAVLLLSVEHGQTRASSKPLHKAELKVINHEERSRTSCPGIRREIFERPAGRIPFFFSAILLKINYAQFIQ